MLSSQPHFYLQAEARFSSENASAAQWHFLLEALDGSSRLEISDDEPDAPSDRLELLALVRGLEAIDQPARVTLVTSSKYVSHGLRFGLDQWRENGWQWEAFGQMTDIKNVDLWRRIDQALTIHRVACKAVRGETSSGDRNDLHSPAAVVVERTDLAHSESPAPHMERPSKRRNATAVRNVKSTAVNPHAKNEPERAGVWQTMRAGVASWLHGLGTAVAPEHAMRESLTAQG